MKTLTVGKLAKESGVNLETVRYYERRGLLPRPSRTNSGYRQYEGDDLLRLQFIKRSQGLGFTLKEIKDLLSLRLDGRRSCETVRRLAETKAADVDARIRDLQRIKKSLARLVTDCRNQANTSECPILDALSSGEQTNDKC